MTSTNSLSSNRFLPMFKNVFKRNLAFFLVVQVFSALYAFFFPRFNLKAIAEVAEYMEEGYQQDLTSSCMGSMAFFLFAAGTLWALILGVSLFREIYSKRASVFYYSMPVKRETYFNVNMLYGVLTVFTSYVLVAALSIIAVQTNNICSPEFYTFEPVRVVKVLTVALLNVIVTYAICMLFAVISGRQWQYIVLSLVAGNLVYAAFAGIINYANVSVWGLNISYDKWWVLSTVAPFLHSLNEENILKFVIVLIIQFALIYLAGYYMFKKRKAETAESNLALNIITETILVLALFALTFTILTSINAAGYVKLGIAAAITVAAVMIITACTRKKAFTKSSVKWLIGILAVMIIIVSVVEFLPNIKYKNYVPAADEVESVVYDESVEATGYNGIMSSLLNAIFLGFDDYDFYDDYYHTYSFSSEESKARIEELHKKMIEQSTIDNQYSDDYYYYNGYSVQLTYKLKNGKTVERFYDVCTKDIYDEYIALMQTEEALRQTEPLNYKDEDIQFISVTDYNFDDFGWLDDDTEYSDSYDYAAYADLDGYADLFDNVIKDKIAEPRDVFYNLTESVAFMLYDPDDIYRDEDYFSLESFWEDDWSENLTYENDYPDYCDVTITFYSYNQNVTDEMKAKFSEMTPQEIKEYEIEYMMYGDGYLLEESMIHLNNEADANTIAYLKSLGLL